MHRVTQVLFCALILSSTAYAAENPREGPIVIAATQNGIGMRIDDFAFTDLDGKSGKLADFKDKKAIVICMTSAGCPVSKKYGPTIAELDAKYRGKGVAFLAVNVQSADTLEKMKAQLAEWRKAKFAGHYIADKDQAIGKLLGARSTTEAFVIDRARTLVYRGAIDDQYGLGYAIAEPRNNYLTRAIDAVLEDQRPAIEASTAPGCALALEQKPAAGTITYHNRISRIVQNNCVECHRPGENGPFELLNYADVKGNAAMIKKVAAKKTMPPWYADNTTAHAFGNNRALSDRDREDLIKWIEAGAPEGDKADAPVTIKFAEGWRIGKPDYVAESALTNKIPAKGTVPYKHSFASTTFEQDKWITSMEIRPTAPEVVHHLLVFIAYPIGDPRNREALRQFNGGLKGYFAGMVPGQAHITFPEGTAKLLPKGAILVFQIHYTPNGKEVTDKPRIGFKFASDKPKHEVKTSAASVRRFEIPAHDNNYEITALHSFTEPTRLLSVNPHAHVRGKAWKYELIQPDGKSEVILNVPHYDFNWQIEYQFGRPIDVPAGAKLKVTAWYDNSKDNPANPDPTKKVKFGEQTWDEMMIGYFTGYSLK